MRKNKRKQREMRKGEGREVEQHHGYRERTCCV